MAGTKATHLKATIFSLILQTNKLTDHKGLEVWVKRETSTVPKVSLVKWLKIIIPLEDNFLDPIIKMMTALENT